VKSPDIHLWSAACYVLANTSQYCQQVRLKSILMKVKWRTGESREFSDTSSTPAEAACPTAQADRSLIKIPRLVMQHYMAQSWHNVE